MKRMNIEEIAAMIDALSISSLLVLPVTKHYPSGRGFTTRILTARPNLNVAASNDLDTGSPSAAALSVAEDLCTLASRTESPAYVLFAGRTMQAKPGEDAKIVRERWTRRPSNHAIGALLKTRGRNLWIFDDVLEGAPGSDVTRCAEDLSYLAKRFDFTFEIDFNGSALVAKPDSDPKEIVEAWRGEMDRKREAYLASKEYKQQVAERERKAKEKKEKLEDLMADAPDEPEWNQDPYGGECVRYAREWARAMEASIKRGQTVTECAEETSHLADTNGITGFMYGAAVSMLAQCWVHGEELRTWHNSKYGVKDSKGTVNPAVLTISPGEGATPAE